MDQASAALVERRYFACEALASDALRKAITAMDFDRVARIVLPLQEARRQIRDLAADTGEICVVDGELPSGDALKAGMYMIAPPRVGVDGRMLREAANRREVPVIVLVREPLTRAGLWPVVAVGPVTVRVRLKPPADAAKLVAGGTGTRKSGAKKGAKEGYGETTGLTREWVLAACEALGDAAIESIPDGLTAAGRVLALAERLEAVPDHEKLHQRLEEAAREAARTPVKRGQITAKAAAAAALLEEEDD